MKRRVAILISLTALVVGSSGLGLYFATPRLERIPKPQYFEPVEHVSARIDGTAHTVCFTEESDGTRVFPIPAGHEEDKNIGGIYSADQQSLLVIFWHELTPFREQETFEVLLNHKWPTARWEFWQFPLAPNRAPRLVAKLDTSLPRIPTYSPYFSLTKDGLVISRVVAAGPEWEEEEHYLLRL